MKKILALVSLLALTWACAAPPPSAPANTNANASPTTSTAAPTEADAMAREKSVWEALRKKDYAAFESLLATDYTEIHSEGVYDKPGILVYLKDLDLTDFTFSDWKFMPIDNDATLMLYNVTITGKFKGQPAPPGPYRASSAWVNRGGKWQAIFYQETLAKPAPPPPLGASPTATATAPAASASPLTAPTDPIEREKFIWDLLKRKQYDAFASFIHEDQVEVETDAVYDRAGTIKGVQMFDPSGTTLSDFKVVNFDPDATLVSYMATDAKMKPAQYRHSTIWVKRGEKWMALFHQGTPVETPPPSTVTPSPTAASTSPVR